MLSLDIAFPRNELNWFENLPEEIEKSFEIEALLWPLILSCITSQLYC